MPSVADLPGVPSVPAMPAMPPMAEITFPAPAGEAPSPAPSAAAAAPAPPAATVAAATGAAAGGDLDELAHKLYDRIRWRLRSELRLDMERAGLGAGVRR
jgi:hypothetical protein